MRTGVIRTFLAFSLLAAGSLAHASSLCAIAGHYEGKYAGDDDHGFVVIDVDPQTGAVTGQAQSQLLSATAVAVGGVVNADGSLSTDGTVASGAVFAGRFLPSGVAAGQWAAPMSMNGMQVTARGSWGVQRVSPAASCQ